MFEPPNAVQIRVSLDGIVPEVWRCLVVPLEWDLARLHLVIQAARPPEDVGGLPGYERFLAILADPEDPEHADTKRWCGGHFDPEWFDLALTDKDVRNALRPNVRRRLHQPRPKAVKPSS